MNKEQFQQQRERQNKLVLEHASLNTKRFFALDHSSYEDGALPKATKELLGLVASMVLRCDDCIFYHIDSCLDAGLNKEEIKEAMEVALIVGGSILIPHLRRAYEYMA